MRKRYCRRSTATISSSIIHSGADGINHNITSEVNGSTFSTETYTYNAAGYPITSSDDFNGDITTTEYFYE
ncbi:hypothetical protein [Flavobacterium sp. GT3R68]|uniref:hypothetical protein n=1 Tax=Flavobacterium sp. GT3R68 TaxID=2594437 RepID=UPI000F86A5A6|nr:hypothetical protein [Flavobacterium sp. GT3R68]RTY86311.1 hypothetical protein EKL32_27840 [Flavobacterium sp. GSN2]TRW91919.1 hypothetical protein FNW07_08525 [Flavobacterium sp. GT3R68]